MHPISSNESNEIKEDNDEIKDKERDRDRDKKRISDKALE